MKHHPIPPRSGHQYTICYGDYRAVITQVGATLRKFTYKGTDLVVCLDPNTPVNCCHGQILVPFPSRIEDGTYTFEGKTYEIPIDEHGNNNAIHGFGSHSAWTLLCLTEDTVSLGWRVPNMVGYPFDIFVIATYRLDADGLHLNILTTNLGNNTAPWAMAFHPWLANGFDGYGDEIDGHNAKCSVRIPAKTHVTFNERLLPTGTEPVDGTKYDLRESTLLTEQPFDDAWTDLEREADGSVVASFTRPDGLTLELGGDETITSFQVCTGTGFPADGHPAGVAVEPQTAYSNAFNTGIDLVSIKPGEQFSSEVFLRVAK